MLRAVVFAVLLGLVAGCATSGGKPSGEVQVLRVRWQRLVDENGKTCERCGGTERATEEGVKRLGRSLRPLGMKVVLEKQALSSSEFKNDPLQSNRMWIGDKPIEEWLGAEVTKSQCSGACGDMECRTLTLDGRTYETVPAELLIRAGLLAGAELMGSQGRNPWNPMAGWSKSSPGCCPTPLGGAQKQ